MRVNPWELRWVLRTFGWIHMRYEVEPMAQINWKYYRGDKEEFRWVSRSFGLIQIRYESEPMAQINCKNYRSDTEEIRWVPRWGMRVNPWLKLIVKITLTTLRIFIEFHRLLAWFSWGMRVNPWLKFNWKYYRSNTEEFRWILARCRWGMRVIFTINLSHGFTLIPHLHLAKTQGNSSVSLW